MHKVELEFKRIQTYLFASPRLRAMLGANAALGHAIRIELPRIAKRCGAVADNMVMEKMPGPDQKDPLTKLAGDSKYSEILLDDPSFLYKSFGVMARDGGHLIATFPSRQKARAFIEYAQESIMTSLPGILLEARLDNEKINSTNLSKSRFQHSAFQVSQHLGNQPVERRGAKGAFVSLEEQQMEERGRTFRNHPADIIALLESRLIPCPDEPPQSLDDVAGDGYLALIHADGNNIGQRYLVRQKLIVGQRDSLVGEAHGEHFFLSMRVAVRSALVKAINEVFAQAPASYQLLMLGGDDLLLACAARYAFPFVCAYTRELKDIPLVDNEPLSIGVGVAIAKHSFPFYRLHAMAETLADSAKRRFRAEPALGSVVDWHITSSSWVSDPIAERRADSLTANAILSGKPYPILGSKGSLEALLGAAERVSRSSVARSQLRTLVQMMRQGATLGELAWMEMPDSTRAILHDILNSFHQEGLFRQAPENFRSSVLPDLVEICEINRKQQ